MMNKPPLFATHFWFAPYFGDADVLSKYAANLASKYYYGFTARLHLEIILFCTE